MKNASCRPSPAKTVRKLGPCPRITGAIFLLVALLATTSAAQPNLKSTPVGDEVVNEFVNARCACSQLDTARLSHNRQGEPFPNAYVSDFPNTAFTIEDGAVPFEIYYAEVPGGQLYRVGKGACRAFHITVPLPAPGFYFVRFYSMAKPALIEVDARTPRLLVRAFGRCEIHESYQPRRPIKSNRP